jgi:hypothetical protein
MQAVYAYSTPTVYHENHGEAELLMVKMEIIWRYLCRIRPSIVRFLTVIAKSHGIKK